LYPLSYRTEARVGLEPTTVRLRWTPGRQAAERTRPDEGVPGDRSATVTPRARRRAGSRTRTSSFSVRCTPERQSGRETSLGVEPTSGRVAAGRRTVRDDVKNEG